MTALSSTATLGEVRQPAEGGPSYIYRGDGIWDLHVVTGTVDLTDYYTKGQIDTALGTRDANITSVASAAAAAATTANAAIPATQKAAANGVASLDASGDVPVDQLGNVPAAPVASVAGRTGAVTLAKADVGLGNVDNTSDANKPVSAATASALGSKQASLGYTPVNKAGDTMSGRLISSSSSMAGTDIGGANYSDFQITNNGVGAAAITLHRQGEYAAHFGLSIDSKFKWGGIGTGASYEFWHENNLTPVRTVNGSGPDGSGNVTVTSGVTDVRLGAQVTLGHGNGCSSGHVVTKAPSTHIEYSVPSYNDGFQRPIQKQVSGTWITVSQV